LLCWGYRTIVFRKYSPRSSLIFTYFFFKFIFSFNIDYIVFYFYEIWCKRLNNFFLSRCPHQKAAVWRCKCNTKMNSRMHCQMS